MPTIAVVCIIVCYPITLLVSTADQIEWGMLAIGTFVFFLVPLVLIRQHCDKTGVDNKVDVPYTW
jgi:hypothetical protein